MCLMMEKRGAGGSRGQMGAGEMLVQWVEGGAQKMEMYRDLHTVKAAVVLACCGLHSHTLDEQGTEVEVLNNSGFQGVRKDRDPWPLQREGRRCCLDPQCYRLDWDPQHHQAEGQKLSQGKK